MSQVFCQIYDPVIVFDGNNSEHTVSPEQLYGAHIAVINSEFDIYNAQYPSGDAYINLDENVPINPHGKYRFTLTNGTDRRVYLITEAVNWLSWLADEGKMLTLNPGQAVEIYAVRDDDDDMLYWAVRGQHSFDYMPV